MGPPDLALTAGALLLALAIDRAWGEPPVRWHPVAWMGHYLGMAGRRVAPVAGGTAAASPAPVFVQGMAAWLLGAAVVTSLAAGLAWGASHLHAVGEMLLTGLLLKPLLAWRMLHREVRAVEDALARSLDQGRARLAWLVSRDVDSLDEGQVRESAIESLAENLNDSVVAPLFWFCLAGLPGAALYRFANTADAMWGYPGERGGRHWQWAGKWAARADDLLSWVPARLTAAMLATAGRSRLPQVARQAGRTPSPNGGWPMAAMALALDIRLGKPGAYVLHPRGRIPQAADTVRALRLASRVVQALALAAAAVAGFAVWSWP